MRKQSPQKYYTDILEKVSQTIVFLGDALSEKNENINKTQVKKMACGICGVSLNTYNKYLKQLKDNTYVRCERK